MKYPKTLVASGSGNEIIVAIQTWQTQRRINRLKKELKFLNETRQAAMKDLVAIENLTNARQHSIQYLKEHRKQLTRLSPTPHYS